MRQGKTLDAIEERMQSANKAYCRDILIYRSTLPHNTYAELIPAKKKTVAA